MENIELILRFIIAFPIAFLMGKLISKIKLPAILGWLLTGMVLGPHAFNLVNHNLLNSQWYHIISQVLECSVGIMLGKELMFKKLKQYGTQIIVITLFESIGTFLIVSLCFGVVFYFTGVPLYLSIIFGGIALATAPAPSLSIVNEFKTQGPVTNTLIPIAMLDDIIAIIVFFSVNSFIATKGSEHSVSIFKMLGMMVFLPIVIGVVIGLIAGQLLKKDFTQKITMVLISGLIIITYSIGYFIDNFVLPAPSINYMMMGMSVFATIANIVTTEKMDSIAKTANPIVGIGMIVMIMNLAAPLDYHLILGAGTFTAIYIVSRAVGKYFSTFMGAKLTHAPKTVRKYLGLTLLPHSGVSLIFTGMAVASLNNFDSSSAVIVQGTISAAAVINEIFAVIIAKKGFQWSGEFDNPKHAYINESQKNNVVITISRQYGSGGRKIGNLLADKLNIPIYDKLLFEETAKDSGIPKSFIEDAENNSISPFSQMFDLAVSSVFTPADNYVFLEQSKTIQRLAQQGSCIIVGRGANRILSDFPKVLNVFIYSDYKKRTKRIVDEYGVKAEDAQKLIQMVDKNRNTYLKVYTNQEFGEAENYHLCINSGIIGIDGAVELIEAAYLKL